MSNATQAVGALRDIILQGRSYKIGELTLGDIADFEQETKRKFNDIRRERMAMAVEMYGTGNVPAEVFREIVADIKQEQVDAEAETMAGSAFLLTRAMQHANENMTEADVRNLITINDIPVILEVLGLKEPESKNAPKPAAG